MKKKPTSGEHKKARINVGYPADWHAIARRLAAKRKTPVLYLLLDILKKEAEGEKMDDIPAPPWEEDAAP